MKKNMFAHLISLKARKSKYFFAGLGCFAPLYMMAEGNVSQNVTDSLSLFANPVFNVLLGIIILLIIVIAILAGVLKSVAEVSARSNNSNKGTTLGIIGFLLLANSQTASAQSSVMSAIESYTTLPNGVLLSILLVIGFELLIIAVLINTIKLFTKKEVEIVVEEPSFFEMMNASVAIEKESDIMLDHNYDGIQELDNDLPPWWKYGFYLTVLVAVIYLFNYHVVGNGLLQQAEYDKSMKMAKEAKEEYQKMNANNVNESSVTLLTDKVELGKGETIYKENCFACHGKLGEGGVGPNLTDQYWLHGGSIKDVFISVKYGWPDKGMKSWQADFSPVQIHQIASYILTLKGSNPANAKAPQGDLYTEVAIGSDSLTTDSTAVIPIMDSLKIASK